MRPSSAKAGLTEIKPLTNWAFLPVIVCEFTYLFLLRISGIPILNIALLYYRWFFFFTFSAPRLMRYNIHIEYVFVWFSQIQNPSLRCTLPPVTVRVAGPLYTAIALHHPDIVRSFFNVR